MLKDIYFLNVSELSNRIRLGEIDQTLMLKHFIAFSILFYTGFSLPISFSGESTSSQGWVMLILTFIVQATIHYYGIWYTYQINAKGDGQAYLNRLFCLALPISIRLLIYAVAISIAVAAVFFMLFSSDIEPNGFLVGTLYILLSGAYSCAFYYLAGKYIRVCCSGS